MNYDDTIDISTENSNLQEISDSDSNSNLKSNDISNEISNADDTADDTSLDVINGSSSKDVLGANRLSASHDFSGSNFTAIQELLDSDLVQEGDTIYLGNVDITSTWESWQNNAINVNKAGLNIIGGSSDNPDGFSTLNGNGACIFKINAPNVSLSNIKFVNSGHNGHAGSAINIQSSGTTITSCSFDNCKSADGGAIYGTASATNTIISDCNFTNNKAEWNNGNGGAVYLNGDATITNCNFNQNTAATSYGGVYIAGSATVSNSNFTDNTGSTHGAALTIEGSNSVVDGCNFINNDATGYASQGGALELLGNDGKVTNSNFEDNSARSGGAIYTIGENTKIENCNFTNNEATQTGDGGAIDIQGDASNTQITDCTFKNNNATNGGAIFAARPGMTVTNSNFEDNTATHGGAIDIYHDDDTITNCNFTNNDASETGGAIYIGDDCHNAQMTNCNFTDNSAPTGTAIYADGSAEGMANGCHFGVSPDLSVENDYPALVLTLAEDYSNIVVGNIEGASSGSSTPVVGADISLEIFDSNGQLVGTVSGVTDANGQIVYDYGHLPHANYTYKAHYLDDKTKEGPITMEEVEGNNFSSIQAAIDNAESGGVIFLKDITYYNDIQGNMVINKPITIIGKEGTVLDAEGLSRIFTISDDVKNVNLNNITFINGHADHGGAVYGGQRTEDLQFTNCDFINNTADIAGGAVKHRSNMTFTDCAFINNSANPNNDSAYVSDEIEYGGGAIWCCDGITNLVNTDFIGNNATYGGAIRGAVNAKGCLVENNTAFNGNGGGIDMTIEEGLFNDPAFMTSVRVEDSIFINNSAQGDYYDRVQSHGGQAQGGAIHIFKVDGMNINNITCINNSAYRGGAIDLYEMNFTNIANSTIYNNTATLGGGVAVVGNHTRFENVTMSENDAVVDGNQDGEGGGIWVIGEDCRILNSTIDHNIAQGQGGGVWISGSDVQLNNTIIDSNLADKDFLDMGGGLYVKGDGCIIHNNTITNNNCTSDTGTGGGININGENCIFTNNTIDFNNANYGGGVYVAGANSNFTNNNMSSNTAETGGGFYVSGNNLYVENLYAFNNTAENGGAAAIALANNTIFKNSTFDNNTAIGDILDDRGEGGAIHISGSTNVLVQADFINNTACNGSAIYVDNFYELYPSDIKVINSTFFENQAWSYLLNITPANNTYLEEGQEFNISVSHQGGDNIINAIYNDADCTTILNNVTYPFMTWDGELINKTTPTEDIRPVMGAENSDYGNLLYQDDFENNQIINVLVKDKNGNVVVDKNGTLLSFEGLKTDIFGDIFIKNGDGTIYRYIPVAGLEPGRYYVEATHPEDRYYKEIYNFTVLRVGPTDLEINKTVSNATCNVSDLVDWNVTVGNIGPIDAENVTMIDTLPAGLDLLNLSFSFTDSIVGNWLVGQLYLENNNLRYGVYNKTSGTWVSNSASYNASTSTWTINIPDIEGNADILKPVIIKLTLNKTDNNTKVTLFVSDLLENSSFVMNMVTNVTEEGNFTNIANVTSDTPETNYTNNVANNTTQTVKTDLSINKTVSNQTCNVSDLVDWNVTTFNNGSMDAVNVTINDFLPYGLDLINLTFGFFNSTGDLWTNASLNLSGKTLNFSVYNRTSGTWINGVAVYHANPDSWYYYVLDIGNATFAYTVLDLEYFEEIFGESVYNDTDRTYTFESEIYGNVTYNEVSGIWTVNNKTFIQKCIELRLVNSSSSNTTNISLNINSLEGNSTVVIHLVTNVTKMGNYTNIANVTSDTPESNYTNNVANNTTSALVHPNMTVEKVSLNSTDFLVVGDTVYFNVTVRNTGDCDLHNVTVDDVFNGTELTYLNFTGAGWTKTGDYSFYLGDLAKGANSTFEIWFTANVNGTLVNNVTAKSNETNETNDTEEVPVHNPNMTVQKVTLDKEVYVGNTTRFTIVVENTGDCVLDNVYVVDTDYDHSALQYLRYENGSRNWNYDDNGNWTLMGTLAIGEKANFTVWFEVLTNGTLENTVTAGSNLTNETNGTNNTTGIPICDLAITKIVNTTHCYVDDLVEWNITVVNRGPSTALDVIVKDVLPEGLKLVDVRGGTYNNDTHEWVIGTLDKDQSVSIVLVTQVLINGTIQNNASVNTTINETNYTNNNATNVTEAEYICDLVITKAVNCSSCYVSDVVEWNITVVNVGPHNATNVIVKDILPEGMELISYRVSVGNFNEVISEWSIGTLEKDTPVSLVLVTKVLIDGTFVNIATVNTTTPESDYTNNEANNTTRADPICDLVIIKVVDSKKVYLGEIVSWTIKITNNGPSEALDVKVEDILPDGLVLLSYKASKGKYVDGVWTVGTLANGASETITLKTNTSGVGNITNPASVNTTTHESNYTNNYDNDTTEVLPYVDLVLIKSSDKPKYNVNDTMHWIIKVVNKGPCDAIDAYVLDVLPSSTKFVSYTSSKGSFDAATGVWSIGDLANGEEAVIDIICKALSAGNFTNNATVTNNVTDVNTSNNYDNATIEVVQEDEPVPEPPEPTPEEPIPPKDVPNISLKTGNPLVVLLIALMAMCGSFALRCRKE
ncbi:right-handed parallel beta-helix repeat-containing protein [Methanobrevibacter sp.]